MALSLPHMLRDNAAKFGPEKIALREKEFGIWQSVTWQQYMDNVRLFALGIVALGYQKGDKLAILGDNRPEWLYSELAMQCLGGAAVGIFPDSHIDQVKYIIDHSDAVFLMAEDQEQVDKFLEIKNSCPKVRHVIVDDTKGMKHYQDPILKPFKMVQEMGRDLDRREPQLFEKYLEQVTGETVALIAYTSGTTGLPKGAMLTHNNMLKMAANYDEIDPAYPTDNHVSFLPLPWVGEQMTAVSWNLYKGFTVNFPEKVETVADNIRDIGPQILFAPPRFWEKICSEIQVKIQDAVWIKRFFYKLCMPIGYKVAQRGLENMPLGPLLGVADIICHFLMFRSLKNYFGLGNLRNVYTGGAALGPEIFHLFQALGVNIKQIYGQTETSGISVGHRNRDIKLHTVGRPIPGMEIKISDTGEILTRGPTVFAGYYKDEESTRKALVDGWLHSGDQGIVDEQGHLVMIDRMKDVMKLTDGTKFSPQLIENKIKFSVFVAEAVVVGKDRPYVAAMINIDMANVGKWAENRKLSYTTYTDLSQKDEVYELIAQEVAQMNLSLPKAARVKRFVMLHKELDADDDEMTRTRKVRRSFVEQRYSQLVEALYGDQDRLDVVSDIKYRDGKEFRMQTRVQIKTVPEI
ncbi:MAG: AMP-binding protein [Desulfomonile tiedjei]|uniref:AMP-binding protein n=1 Tax=Desulfomonile tiedjei TaxID=2358 RepID=A0A9D6V6J8_9BACT|nr:AMP-binding protein [Desulfomonile tiedjei]